MTNLTQLFATTLQAFLQLFDDIRVVESTDGKDFLAALAAIFIAQVGNIFKVNNTKKKTQVLYSISQKMRINGKSTKLIRYSNAYIYQLLLKNMYQFSLLNL